MDSCIFSSKLTLHFVETMLLKKPSLYEWTRNFLSRKEQKDNLGERPTLCKRVCANDSHLHISEVIGLNPTLEKRFVVTINSPVEAERLTMSEKMPNKAIQGNILHLELPVRRGSQSVRVLIPAEQPYRYTYTGWNPDTGIIPVCCCHFWQHTHNCTCKLAQ